MQCLKILFCSLCACSMCYWESQYPRIQSKNDYNQCVLHTTWLCPWSLVIVSAQTMWLCVACPGCVSATGRGSSNRTDQVKINELMFNDEQNNPHEPTSSNYYISITKWQQLYFSRTTVNTVWIHILWIVVCRVEKILLHWEGQEKTEQAGLEISCSVVLGHAKLL